jgi:hypothetical protein
MKRVRFLALVALALLMSSIGGVAAALPPQASCAAHLVAVIGPPGLVVAEERLVGFGRIVSFVATAEGTNFEECFEALLEANE